MTRTYLLMILMGLFAATMPVMAQDEPTSEPDAKEDTEEVGIPVDFNEYLKTVHPGLDPGGDHDIFNLRDPKDPDERHEYVQAMTIIVAEYMTTLRMGAMVSKVFDQYSRGEAANQLTFKVLYALTLNFYPPGQPNQTAMQEKLREAAVDDFAYPHYMLAQIEYSRFQQGPNVSPQAVLDHINKALGIRPKFLKAMLLKCQVFMAAQPAKTAEVRAMIEPWINGALPEEVNNFDNLMKMYAQSHTSSDLHNKIDKLLKSNHLSDHQKARALQLSGTSHFGRQEVDEAIEDFNKSLDFIVASEQPNDAIRTQRFLAGCKLAKTALLKREDPDLDDPANKQKWETLVEEIRAHHERMTVIEKEHLPKALRGNEALEYVLLLWRDLNEPEQALIWLEDYVENTELSGPQRSRLSNLQASLDVEINPTEANTITSYENFVASDNMVRLATALSIARASIVQQGEQFEETNSLNFFISQIPNRERRIVMDASFLALHTAGHLGDDAVARASAAVADRLEDETELSSDEQANLLEDLSRSLRDMGDRASQERAIRNLATILEDTPAITTMKLRQVKVIWEDEAFLRDITEAPRKLRLFDGRKPDKVAEWLRNLADAVKAQAESDTTEEE